MFSSSPSSEALSFASAKPVSVRYGIGDFLFFALATSREASKALTASRYRNMRALSCPSCIFYGFSQNIDGLLIIVGGIDIGFP
jgi:hypothetical protein